MIWEGPVFWHWLALGIVLVIVEILVPGVVFVWLGIAAIVTGLAVLAAPTMDWQIQALIFAGLSVVSVVAGRAWIARRDRDRPTDHPHLNQRGLQYVGQRFTLDEATKDGRGRMRIGDTAWTIQVLPQGENLDAGEQVTVLRIEGTVFQVERFTPSP
jgi:membrane protein implicated in regulation of membrane protease activity